MSVRDAQRGLRIMAALKHLSKYLSCLCRRVLGQLERQRRGEERGEEIQGSQASLQLQNKKTLPPISVIDQAPLIADDALLFEMHGEISEVIVIHPPQPQYDAYRLQFILKIPHAQVHTD